jgi:hypothetical protein
MPSFPAEDVSRPAGTRLLLAEQLMLLAFQDSGGRPVRGARSYLRVGLPGAVLAELALRHTVVIPESPPAAGKRRVLASPGRSGDPLLDTMAAWIEAEQPRSLAWWIKYGSRSGLRGQVLDRLSAAGLVTTSPGAFGRRSRLASPAARATVAARVEQALLAGPARAAALWTADPWSASLTSLAFACRVLQVRWLPRGQRQAAKASLAVIRRSDPIGQAVAALVHEGGRSGR